MRLRAAFFALILFTMAGIFLHELAHHLFGAQSLMSLSRNWPQVPVTAANHVEGITGTLAGPAVNTLLGYIGLCLFRFGKPGPLKSAGLYGGLANLFLTASGASVNLLVDWLSGTWGNDLQVVSRLLGWPVLILPALFVALSLPGLLHLFCQWIDDRRRRPLGALILFGAWVLGGVFLMLPDAIFRIRFALV